MSTKKSILSRGVAEAKADVRSDRDVKEIMRSGQTTEAVVLGQAREVSRVKNKSEALTASVATRGAVKGKVAGDMVNEKANAQIVKEEIDPAERIVNHAKEASQGNLARASLTAALATTVAHQDQVETSATDAAEVEVEVRQTTRESESEILQTSRMATRSAADVRHTPASTSPLHQDHNFDVNIHVHIQSHLFLICWYWEENCIARRYGITIPQSLR